MIVLFTDFGAAGPYIGQMRAVLHDLAPQTPIIDLFNDAPSRDPKASAYLLAPFVAEFPARAIFLCVVDPGVGSERRPVIVEANNKWFVGPDNGLFEIVMRRAEGARSWHIEWRPEHLSASFHGRDLFAPVAGQLAKGANPPGREIDPNAVRRPDWSDDLDQIVYIDHFGNAVTGRRAETVPANAGMLAEGRRLEQACTFSNRSSGEAFWYENANGLAEIAVNMGRADKDLGLAIGTPVQIARQSPITK